MADSVRNILVRMTGDPDDANRSVRSVIATLKELPRSRDFRFDVNFQRAKAAMKDLRAEIASIPNAKTVHVRARIDEAKRALTQMEVAMKEIDQEELSPRARVEIREALGDIAFMKAELASIPEEHTTHLTVEMRKGIMKEIDGIDRRTQGLLNTFSYANKPTQTFGDSMEAVFTSIRRFVPLIAGFALLIGVSLVSALAAVGSAAAAAVGGIVSFASSLVASLGPALVLILNLMQRFGAISDALTAFDAERKSAFRESAKSASDLGKEQAKQARIEGQAAEKAAAMRDARQAVTRAERAYREAVAAARQEVRDAIAEQKEAYEDLRDARVKAAEDIQDAEDRVADANRDLEEAAEAAYDTIAEAARDARDAVTDLRDAQLDLLDAQDEVSDIEREIEKLLKDMGTLDPAAALKKLEDVDLQGFDSQAFLIDIGVSTDEEKIEKLDDLTRDLERAKNDVTKANNNLTDSEDALIRKQQEHNVLQQHGIAAVDGYRTAVNNLHDANKRLIEVQGDAADSISEAEAKYVEAGQKVAELRARDLQDIPAVVAASEQLRDAHEGVADAARRASVAAAAQATALEAPTAAASNLAFELDNLSDSEQNLLTKIIALREAAKHIFEPSTNAIVDSLARALTDGGMVVFSFRNELNALGEEYARQIDLFSQELFDAKSMSQFGDFIDAGQTFTRLLGDIGRDGVSTFLNFAHAGLEPTEDVLTDINHALDNMREKSEDQQAMEKVTKGMADSLRIFLDLIGAVTAAFAEFVALVKPFGDEFVKWITDAVNGFREWMRSDEGREQIKAFFRDTLPFAKALITFIFKLGKVFLQMFQFAAPFLKAAFDGFSLVLDVVSILFTGLNKIPAPIRSIMLSLIPFVGVLGRIPFIGKLIVGSFSRVVAVFGFLSQIGGDIVAGLLEGLAGLPEKIVQVFVNMVNAVLDWLGISSPSTKFIGIGKSLVEGVIAGFKALPGLFVSAAAWMVGKWVDAVTATWGRYINLGKTVIQKIASGVTTVVAEITGFGAWLLEKLRNALPSLGDLSDLGKTVIRRIASGVTTVVEEVSGFGGWLIEKLRHAVGRAFKDVLQLGKDIIAGIGKGIFEGIPDLAKDVGKGIIKGIGGALGIGSPAKAMIPLGRDTVAGFLKGVSEDAGLIRDEFRSLTQGVEVDPIQLPEVEGDLGDLSGLTEGLSAQLPTFGELGNEALTNLTEGFSEDAQPVEGSVEWFQQEFDKIVRAQDPLFAQTGQRTITTVAFGLRTQVPLLAGFGAWLQLMVARSTHAQEPQFRGVGLWTVGRIVDGLRTNTDLLTGFGGFFKNRIDDSVHIPDVQEELKRIGRGITNQIVEGMKQALEGGKKNPLIGGKDGFGSKLVGAIESFFDIHSPSKLMMGLGENITEGLLVGMNRKDVGSVIRSQLGGMVRFARNTVLNAPDWIPGSGFGSYENMAKMGLELWDRDHMKLGSIPDRLFDEIFNFPGAVLDRYFGKESQEDIAAIIVAVGKNLRATDKEMIAAIAAALVESNLRNVAPGKGDRDSVGVFQQRPSTGWGSAKQILNPFYAARKFFERARDFRGQSLDPGSLAQKVQVSAFPERYGQRIMEALDWLARMGVRVDKKVYKDEPITGGMGGKSGFLGPLNPWARSERSTNFLQQWVAPVARSFGLQLTDFWRSVANATFHNVGRAMDWSNAGREGSPQMMAFFKEALRRWGKMLMELIYSHAGKSVKYGKVTAPYAVADHWDHVHIALAKGGLVSGPVAALIGEGRYREAVLPLSEAVMRRLAQAITSEMTISVPQLDFSGLSGAALSGTMGDASKVYHQQFNIPPAAPSATQPDPKVTAALLADELRRR
jgi:hypothetical protein